MISDVTPTSSFVPTIKIQQLEYRNWLDCIKGTLHKVFIACPREKRKKRTRGEYYYDQHIVWKYNSITLVGGPMINKPSQELVIDGKTKT